MAYLRSVFRASSLGAGAAGGGGGGAAAGSAAGNNNNNNNNNNDDEDEEMSSSASSQPVRSPGVVVLSGYLKKQKSMKKKFFALKADAPGFQACLEYYDSKKKYESLQPPKRALLINKCHSVEKRLDGKQRYVLGFCTKNERLNLLMENENEAKKWMDAVLLLQSYNTEDGEPRSRPTFEHIWMVNIHKKGLGKRNNMSGPHRLHLTDRALTLVKNEEESKLEPTEIPLTTIRRSGCMEHIFYIEVGRSASIGDGELWMDVEDSNIAQNMHYTINNAMIHSNPSKLKVEDDGPRQRFRSSSANEASKPISVLQRRHTAQKLHSFSPLEEQRIQEEQIGPLKEKSVTASAPSQCTQLQTTSTSNTHMATTGVTESRPFGTLASTKSGAAVTNRRRHSVASHSIPSANNNISLSIHTNTTSSSSTTSTTATATVSHQRTLSLPLATVAINQTQSSKRSMLRCVPTGRDRCDSLPSRARTTSESYPSSCSAGGTTSTMGSQHVVSSRLGHLLPHSLQRPHSMHQQHGRSVTGAGMSYSPPLSSMPISPASGACSTDSAGSSLSMDEGSENTEEGVMSKYGHSLTPDEPVILEENGDDYVPWSAGSHQKFSPNFKSCSPSQQSSYVEMYSPCGSSPGRSGYMPMSPATMTGLHSRTSSLVEEGTTLPDDYVPMAPLGDDGYVDMDPSNNSQHQHHRHHHHPHHNGHFPDDMSQHGGSSCSVTSGTPSTDMRFSEFHLEKANSFLAPAEDLQARPTRAYSVGSRPDQAIRQRKNKLDIAQQELSRVRAFSVGSRSKKPELGRLANVVTAPLVPGGGSGIGGTASVQSSKSNSAPLLSSSWGHTTNSMGLTSSTNTTTNNDRMEDLMELDFSKPSPPVTFSPPSSYSQSKSYSTATDTSSYVDMSPGQPPVSSSTTASYVDMNGPSKINRNNNNNSNNNINNNNITTANHNHSHSHSLIMPHKPVITQITSMLKPVEEQEAPYMRMDRGGSMEDWSHSGISPKQVSSPCQEDYMQMNGPPGGRRTAPMDLPQPRRPPPEGYVEMSFKPKPSLEQDYTNMTLGPNRSNQRHRQHSNNNRKKKCSLPIAIQPSSKSYKTPNYLPLSDSPTSESLTSTPASPPRATPTGSTSTIFPFSLNSPQSPVKPFTTNVMSKLTITTTTKSSKTDGSNSSVKNDGGNNTLLITTRKISAQSPVPGVDGCPSFKKAHDNSDSSLSSSSTEKRVVTTEKLGKTLNSSSNSSTSSKEPLRLKTQTSVNLSQDPAHPISPITKKLSDLTVSKPRLLTSSPTTTSPTPTGFKPVQQQQQQSKPASPKPASPKILEDAATPTPTPTPTSTPTPTPSPMENDGYEKLQPGATTSNPLDSEGYEKLQPGAAVVAATTATPNHPLDSEGYEKLQPGATLLHYASLELPEASGVPPVSPTPAQEGFNYVEIDFIKSKQN